MSPVSPGVVQDDETIIRLVVTPMHVDKKLPKLKSSFFDYVFSQGLSAQRLDHVANTELVNTVNSLISNRQDRAWIGYVQCQAKDIRRIKSEQESVQQFCVYDAALPPPNAQSSDPPEPDNPAHAEIHASRRIPEAEQIEWRAELTKIFNAKGILSRRSLRDSAIWNALSDDLKCRAVPQQWVEAIG
jgi:hypothetical protein